VMTLPVTRAREPVAGRTDRQTTARHPTRATAGSPPDPARFISHPIDTAAAEGPTVARAYWPACLAVTNDKSVQFDEMIT
jgi:hypothetical protein